VSYYHAVLYTVYKIKQVITNILFAPLVGVRNCEVSRSACLSVCLSVRSRISKTSCPNFTKRSMHVVCLRGSFLLCVYFRFCEWRLVCKACGVADVMQMTTDVISLSSSQSTLIPILSHSRSSCYSFPNVTQRVPG